MKIVETSILLAFILFMTSFCAQAESTTEDFDSFAAALGGVVEDRDWENLRNIVASPFTSSIGPESGLDDFLLHWKPQSPRGKFWTEMELLLRLGQVKAAGSQRKCLGYPSPPQEALDEEFIEDSSGDAFLIADIVLLRQSPEMDAVVMGIVTDRYVSLNERTNLNTDWTPVIDGKGREGFVDSALLRTWRDPTPCFEKLDGHWKMVSFVGAD